MTNRQILTATAVIAEPAVGTANLPGLAAGEKPPTSMSAGTWEIAGALPAWDLFPAGGLVIRRRPTTTQ